VFKQREYKESLKTPNIYKYIYNLKTVWNNPPPNIYKYIYKTIVYNW
jgi:hypothetical protein